MIAFKQQVVLIVYSSSTPLALALCVCDAVLDNALNRGSSQAYLTAAMAFFLAYIYLFI